MLYPAHEVMRERMGAMILALVLITIKERVVLAYGGTSLRGRIA